jgi:hypothetical protein
MDRGISPTVREGSAIPCPQSEPSLTVGLMPCQERAGFLPSLDLDCIHDQGALRAKF